MSAMTGAGGPAIAWSHAPPLGGAQDRLRGAESAAGSLAFAWGLLREQGVSAAALPATARALALVLERGAEGPVTLSGVEAARLCGFEPRTWWLVRRRLLSLGHLVASAGGGPPQGLAGGRGRKASYAIAPATLERFRAGNRDGVNAPSGMPPPETLNTRAANTDGRSHHRPRPLEEKRTSDVLKILEGRELGAEAPPGKNCERLLRLLESEPRARVRIALARALEVALVAERLAATGEREERLALLTAFGRRPLRNDAPGPGVPAESEKLGTAAGASAPPKTVNAAGITRRPRAAEPLWPGDRGEEARTLGHVRAILAWANEGFGASFDVARSARDARRYPYEVVRAAVANVLLKKARGYRFTNPGAVLWDAITLPAYKLEEFAVARLDEVERLCAERPGDPPSAVATPRPPTPRRPPSEPERARQEARRAVFASLTESARRDLEAAAECLVAGRFPAKAGPLGASLRALRVLEAREEILEREHRAAIEARLTGVDPKFGGTCRGRDVAETRLDGPSRT